MGRGRPETCYLGNFARSASQLGDVGAPAGDNGLRQRLYVRVLPGRLLGGRYSDSALMMLDHQGHPHPVKRRPADIAEDGHVGVAHHAGAGVIHSAHSRLPNADDAAHLTELLSLMPIPSGYA